MRKKMRLLNTSPSLTNVDEFKFYYDVIVIY